MKLTAGIKADITLYPVYKCSVCGKSEAGDSIRETIRGYFAEDIAAGIEKIKCPARCMPVGWSNGPSGFFCQCISGTLIRMDQHGIFNEHVREKTRMLYLSQKRP